MKKLISLLFLALLTTIAAAQVSKTINVATAGTLGSLLTATEKTTVTNLTITGTIDARDFVTMRDTMTVLAVVDISTVNIAYYNGWKGTYDIITSYTYPKNMLPEYSFCSSSTNTGKTSLKSITLPSSVTSIGGYAFSSCSGLTSVTIPSSVASIGNYAFYNCIGLTSVTIPSSVTSIENYVFRYCSGLTSVTIPTSVTSIGNYAFSDCSGLTSAKIPSSVTSIGLGAFYSCYGLNSITIPSSVTSIGSGAFFSCLALNSIIAYPATPVNLPSSNDVFYSVNKASCILFVPTTSLSLYKSSDQWKDFTNIISLPLTITTTTTKLTNVTATTASGGGNVIIDGGFPVSARGICWSTTANPTVANSKTTDGTGTGIFSSTITGLSQGTTYHVRAYATNSTETAYGYDLTFTTLNIPTINTTAASLITATTATSGGNITSDGGASVTIRGICWSTITNPTIANNKTTDGTGTGNISSNITGLSPGTTYHIRAYATNSVGTAYGSDITFTTLAIPTLNTTVASLITGTTATTGGYITSDGGASITSRGVCLSTTANPTISNSKTADGTGTGTFISNITGLIPITIYHIRAYAINSVGIAYGSDLTFTTLTYIPIINTNVASLITGTTATTGGNIINDGGFTVTARGVCWSTTANPTITNNKTADGTGTGTFSSKITGLNSFTTYHIRAYATNSAGTAYGSDITFTTLVAIPIINTTVASLITGTTSTAGGNITNDGGFTVTARGVCWSTTTNPTIANSKTTDGTGIGTFSSKITGLNPGTTYHVRAYATNSAGTAYGSDITFTTLTSSTEVYLNNIAFISSAQDGTQLNVPSAMTMNSTNPNNYVNSGNLVRFKMQCFNKKSNGINIVSGSCKVRCNDSYITLTDSTSGLNNVGWNASAWSSDEFEIQINSTTPWGYIAYVDFEVIEGSNSYFTYKVPILVAPLSLQSKTVDDDNNPDSKGNSNGICEPNEIIETLPTLQNVSSFSANSVSGTFGSYYGAASINVWNNKQGSSGIVVNNSYWNYAFGAPQVITVGAKDLIPQWDFVFDYNYTKTLHFKMGLAMSGSFNLFSGYKSYIKWLIAIDYNVGYPEFNTAISDNYIDNIDFYPNPTNGIININIGSGNFTDCLVNITNSLGQKVYNSKLYTEKTTLDLTKISKSGLLFIQIINNKGAVIGEKKILVE